MADDFDDLTREELQGRARLANLVVSGSKTELIERLRSRDRRAARASSASASAGEAIAVARRELRDTIGVDIETVTSAQRDASTGDWTIEIQTVEARRIPPSSDVIALFTVTVSSGQMSAFDRIRRGRRDTLEVS